MSAQTRNDSRYERQAHAHVFSSRPHHESKPTERTPPHLISCGGIVPVWGSSPPKQELFHRNFGGTRQSGGAGHAPESVSRFGVLEWDGVSARRLNRKACPILSQNYGMHFPLEASTGNCIPAWRRIPGCTFRQGPQTETAAHNSAEKWAAVSPGLPKDSDSSPTPPAVPSRA